MDIVHLTDSTLHPVMRQSSVAPTAAAYGSSHGNRGSRTCAREQTGTGRSACLPVALSVTEKKGMSEESRAELSVTRDSPLQMVHRSGAGDVIWDWEFAGEVADEDGGDVVGEEWT